MRLISSPLCHMPFRVHLSECDVGVYTSLMRVSKFSNTQVIGCLKVNY